MIAAITAKPQTPMIRADAVFRVFGTEVMAGQGGGQQIRTARAPEEVEH